MKYKVIFIEYGYEFTSVECSEQDADTLLSRLKDKGITACYKSKVQ
jgi:hypothetical protein